MRAVSYFNHGGGGGWHVSKCFINIPILFIKVYSTLDDRNINKTGVTRKNYF